MVTRLPSRAPGYNTTRGCRMHSSVITSYSIHYTKLYEISEGIDVPAFTEGLEQSTVLCNSDKYSFCLNMMQMPSEQRKMMLELVITSYSIHYTKLYDCSQLCPITDTKQIMQTQLIAACGLYCANCRTFKKGKCPGCAQKQNASWCKIRRITSYNVCYTKLLRPD